MENTLINNNDCFIYESDIISKSLSVKTYITSAES